MLTAALFFAVSVFAVGQVEVSSTNENAPWKTKIVKISDGVATFEATGSRKELAFEELRTVRITPPTAAVQEIFAELRDGSKFPVTSITSDEKSVSAILPGDVTLDSSPENFAHIQLQPLNEAQTSQWQAIVKSRISADMLILIRSPESLDKIEGLIETISEENIRFNFDGQIIPAPVSKLAGVRFYSPNEPTLEKLVAVVRDTSGGTWMASGLSSAAGETLSIRLRSGLLLELPFSQVSEIDFSVGSTKYLVELEPLERKVATTIPSLLGVAGSEQLFGSQVFRTSNKESASTDLMFFGGGSATYRIPEDFVRLKGSVGLASSGTKFSPCRVTIELEKKRLFETVLESESQIDDIDVEVSGGRRLTIQVDPLAKNPIGDVVSFKSLRLSK